MQMWTGPVEIVIDELFIIMGPNVEAFLSHEDSYIHDECDEAKLREPYDPSNMYNIFENQLKLKAKARGNEFLYNFFRTSKC